MLTLEVSSESRFPSCPPWALGLGQVLCTYRAWWQQKGQKVAKAARDFAVAISWRLDRRIANPLRRRETTNVFSAGQSYRLTQSGTSFTSFTMAAVEVAPVSIPEQRKFEGLFFPLVLSPTTPATNGHSHSGVDLSRWVAENQRELEQLALKHGAVLLRGFAVPDPTAFNAVVEALGHEELPYIGGAAPRTLIVGRVFTANEAPAASVIPFHHEMAQVGTTEPAAGRVLREGPLMKAAAHVCSL